MCLVLDVKKYLALVLAVIFLFSGCGGKVQEFEIENNGKYQMSTKFSDFTVALNGKVLKFPCEQNYLESLGWHLLEDDQLPAGKYNLYTLTNGDYQVGVYLANFSDEAVAPKQALVCGIKAESHHTAGVELPNGIKHRISTKAEVKKVLEDSGFSGTDTLKYEVAENAFINLAFSEGVLSEVEVLNLKNPQKLEVIKTPPDAVKNYKTPDYLSDDLADFTFYLYGKTYTFPLPLSELLKGGFLKAGQSCEYLKPHERVEDAVKITKGNRTITVGLKNVCDYATTLENCMVTSIESKTSKKLDMTLANGCRVGTTASNLENTFGKKSFTKIKKTKEKTKYIYKADGKGTLTVTANNNSGYITKIKFEAE